MTKSANPSQQTYRESGLVQSPFPDMQADAFLQCRALKSASCVLTVPHSYAVVRNRALGRALS